MTCAYQHICGGCRYRDLSYEEYCTLKKSEFLKVMSGLSLQPTRYGKDIFIADGQRRRASLTFVKDKQGLKLGFNAFHSSEVVDIATCTQLTSGLNQELLFIRTLLEKLLAEPFVRSKGRKKEQFFLKSGDVFLCEAANGIDVVLDFSEELGLNHRQIIFEGLQSPSTKVIRISQRRRADSSPETIVEKSAPYLVIGGITVFIPAGGFLQASQASETALISQVQSYLGSTEGRIADLFCGLGTFSYPLSNNKNNKIMAVDSSVEALDAFRKTINRNQIPNITVVQKNLFKYPLDTNELQGFDAVIFDPPRAGASAQAEQLAALDAAARPSKIIAISCNPQSFVRDANILQHGGYHLQEVTMVDQFVYSPHTELVALFTALPPHQEEPC